MASALRKVRFEKLVEQPPGGAPLSSGGGGGSNRLMVDENSSDDAQTPLHSPRSQNTSREEDDSSNANESDCKSPSQRTKSNQRWMKLRTTVQISSAIQKKPPLKREDSFLKRFSSRQIPEAQETVEDTGSEGGGPGGDNQSHPRRRRRQRKQPRTVVNPDENFYFYWLLVLTICVLYNMWTLIVRQSFPELQSMVSKFWFCCDLISDIVFLFDVIVQLRTGYLEQGLMVYDSKKLACHYLRSRAFLLDLAALCPLDLLQIRLGPQPLLRCPRFFKVYRAVNYYYMVESRTVWPNLWRVVNLIHILLILAHWFGCFYFLLSEAEGFQGDWVYPYRPGDYATLTRKYLGSLYWSTLTLTTIGDLPTPETNAEYIFTIVSYLIGVFIFATIVGQVGNVITNRNANRLEFERLLDGAKTYMRHHKVPGGMKRRVLRWYDYSWSRGRIQGGGDINTALGLLPDKLKTELALHVNLSVLKKVTIFQECQPEFLRDLVLKMKAYIFTPGDSICRKGEVAREMFIIADGILEVISEHGKVLTTMKAGDFFGEIGILNLDGLNKRTADVRSVGYSELFSLSREDVLAAMKDYPEAQEILQALGRKRLMEVKASARNPPHHKDHHHGHHHHHLPHVPDPKGLVDKIKNEAKGLKNVLKKSRTHRKSDESLELQPLHVPSNNNNKGTLKRMSRVRSHDLSQEENEKKETSEPTISPLGAGLPLLQRLRLLKEKQDNEERAKSATPPILSPSSSVRSPPPIPEEVVPETIGAGLPLLQRILMLKAKEDKMKSTTTAQGTSSVEKPKLTRTGSIMGGSSNPASPISKQQETTGVSSTITVTTSQSSSLLPRGSISKSGGGAKISFRDRIKFVTGSAKEPPPITAAVQVAAAAMPPAVPTVTEVKEPSSEQVKESDSSEVDKTEPPWSKLKKAAISREISDPSSTTTTTTTTSTTSTITPPTKDNDSKTSSGGGSEVTKPKPKLILTARTKHYRSIDDLSPEYGGLPFVKKLKILNERQKLEELETVMKTRSFSLDIPDSQQSGCGQTIDQATITRSQSEGSKMHHDNNKNLLTTPLQSSELHSSTESNETPERRNLKSILKKLSEETHQKSDELQQQTTVCTTTAVTNTTDVMPKKIDSMEFRKLMRAPTIEGYAARHSKLSKSVTFNRDTLQSPPNSATLVGHTTPNLFSYVNSPPPPLSPSDHHQQSPQPQQQQQQLHHQRSCELPLSPVGDQNNYGGIQIVPNKSNNHHHHQVKLIKTSLDDEQQYFADILLAIKQVMSNHLQDMQEKFLQRFEKLEEEVRNKDEIINQLKAHIHELERNTDESMSDSFDTVVSRERSSWDEASHEEVEEMQDLPQRPLSPTHIRWSPLSSTIGIGSSGDGGGSGGSSISQQNVVLDIDSATTTGTEDTDDNDDEEHSSTSSSNQDSPEYENSSSNWEIELLAAQIREKRSASLDHSSGRPIRRRFTRGGSAELRND